MNKAILIGNLANDVETRTTTSGKMVAQFRLATQRRYTNAQGVREADFHTIVCWGKTAENCTRYIHKGSKVSVEGSIQYRSYDAQDGSKRYVTEIMAENVEFLSSAKSDDQSGFVPQQNAPRQAAPNNGGFMEVDDDELPF